MPATTWREGTCKRLAKFRPKCGTENADVGLSARYSFLVSPPVKLGGGRAVAALTSKRANDTAGTRGFDGDV